MIFLRNLLSSPVFLTLALLPVASGWQAETETSQWEAKPTWGAEREMEVITAAAAAVQAPSDAITTVPLGGFLSGTTLEYLINIADARAGGQDTVTMSYSVPQDGWVAIGFTNGNGLMIGSEAVIALPETGQVLKHNLASYANTGVVPMPDNQQTLIDASVVQENGTTKMQFTKILNEVGELPIAIGGNTFIAAFGSSNMLSYHASRDSFEIDFVAGAIEIVETRKRSLWKAHGWCAALAWGILSPLAIGVAMLRYWFPDGLWLKIHQGLNYSVLVFTILAFVFAVAAIQTETPAGGAPNHFNSSVAPHRLIGLVVFLFVAFQTLGGQFRPHNPTKGEVKTATRRSWEVAHRVAGISLVGTAWYQIQSGIEIYQNLFADSADTNLIGIFWGVIGTLVGLIVVGFVVTKNVEKKDQKERANSEEEEVENDANKV